MLQKSIITIPLGLGVNTKADEKLVEMGRFNLVAENASFEKVGAVKKRQAFESLSTTYYKPANSFGGNTGNYTALSYPPTMLASLGNSVFLRGKTGEYLYKNGNDFILNDSRPIPEARIEIKRIFSPETTVKSTDCDYDPSENMVVASFYESGLASSASTVRTSLVLYNRNTDSTITCPEVVENLGAGSMELSRAAWTRVGGKSYYYHIYVNAASTTLHVDIFDKNGQTYTGLSYANINSIYAVAICRNPNNETLYIMAPTSTASTARFIAISGSSQVSNTTFTVNSIAWTTASARFDTLNTRINLVYDPARKVVLSTAGSVVTADALLTGISATGSYAYYPDQEKIVISGASTWDYDIQTSTQTLVNRYSPCYAAPVTLSGISFSYMRPTITSLPIDDGQPYMLMPTTGESAGSKIFGRFLALQADRATSVPNQLARSSVTSTSEAVFSASYFTGTNGTEPIQAGCLVFVQIAQDFKSNSRAIIGTNLHMSGGFLAEFDGEKLTENGFLTRCPDPVITLGAAGDLTGSYSYCAVLRYIDKNGNITRSAPSNIVAAPAATADRYVIDMFSAPFGVRASNCTVEIYRTLAGGSTLHLSQEIPVDMYSSGSAWPAGTQIDNNTDASISDNPILYTSGDVLQNDPAPACKHVSQWGNRLICAGLEDENEIAYSKEKLFGESVNFSDLFRIRFDTAQYSISGGVVATQGMDDKLVAFKKSSIFYVSGRGPNELGVGTFTEPFLVSSEAGCTEPRSLVITPRGIMFKGEKGIYLLSRGLDTNYIGAAIEAYNSYNCVAAIHDEKKNLVNFILKSSSAGVIASYDYYTEQWSIIPDRAAVDADMLGSSMAILESSMALVQNGTDFTDNAGTYSVKIRTPWIKVSGLQDFSRVWSCTILGKYKSAHDLMVVARYDYDLTNSDVYTVTPSVSDSQYEYRIHLKRQKCVAVQFEIYDSNQSGESMELTALSLEVGLKSGTAKLSAGRKY